MAKRFPRVAPKYLLLTAGIVWTAAGGNILRIGILDFISGWQNNGWYLLGTAAVFLIFMRMIFYPLVQKHNTRILGMKEEKAPLYHFFDKKSYIMMICMMTGGILLRSIQALPDIAIGFSYCGIGAALVGAGVLFFQKFAAARGRCTAGKDLPHADRKQVL